MPVWDVDGPEGHAFERRSIDERQHEDDGVKFGFLMPDAAGNYHLKKVFDDSELEENSVIRNFRITAADGKSYDTKHYNLAPIIAVGYKVNSERAVQFRKWANTIVESFTRKGYRIPTTGVSARLDFDMAPSGEAGGGQQESA